MQLEWYKSDIWNQDHKNSSLVSSVVKLIYMTPLKKCSKELHHLSKLEKRFRRESKMQNIFQQIPCYIFIAAIWKGKKSISQGTIHMNLIWAIHFHTLLVLGRVLLFLLWVKQGLLQATSQRVWFSSKLKQSCWQRASPSKDGKIKPAWWKGKISCEYGVCLFMFHL